MDICFERLQQFSKPEIQMFGKNSNNSLTYFSTMSTCTFLPWNKLLTITAWSPEVLTLLWMESSYLLRCTRMGSRIDRQAHLLPQSSLLTLCKIPLPVVVAAAKYYYYHTNMDSESRLSHLICNPWVPDTCVLGDQAIYPAVHHLLPEFIECNLLPGMPLAAHAHVT